MTTILPLTVPVLTPSKIHRGSWTDHHGCWCLVGWMGQAFIYLNKSAMEDRCRAYSLASQAIHVEAARHGYEGLMSFSDRCELETVADVWNRAMERLGYTRDGDRFVLAAPSPIESEAP